MTFQGLQNHSGEISWGRFPQKLEKTVGLLVIFQNSKMTEIRWFSTNKRDVFLGFMGFGFIGRFHRFIDNCYDRTKM
jgi:hypothetical protein